jgi:hypothetical protein
VRERERERDRERERREKEACQVELIKPLSLACTVNPHG